MTALKLFVKEQLCIVKKQLEEMVSYNQPDKSSSYISSLKEEIEYLREENRAETLIMKQMAEIKTMVNTTSTLVTCDDKSLDKTIQNSNIVINKTIQNNNKELLKSKNTNKNLANMETLSTTDNLTTTCLEHPLNENNVSIIGKNTSKASEKKSHK